MPKTDDHKLPSTRKIGRCRRLFSYIAAYWRGWLLLCAVTIVSIPFALLQPWPMQVLADHVLNGKPVTSSALAHLIAVLPGAGSAHGLLAWVVAAGLLVFVFNSLLDLILTFGWINVGQRMVYDLARDLFAVIQRRSMVFHTRNFVGDLMSRIVSDSWCINAVADNLLLKPVHVVFTLVSMAVVMAAMDLQMTLLSLAVAPFMAGSSFLMGRPVRAAARVSREIAAQMQSHVQQTLSGMPVVQAFAQEERAQERFLTFAGARIRAEQRNTIVSSVYALGSGLIITLGNAAILWMGAHHVLASQLSLGQLLVFLSYLTSLHGQMRVLTEIYRTLQQTAASADRVMEMLEPEQDVKERSDAIRLPAIIADNIALGKPAASRGEIEAAARAANAHEFILLLPEGYDTVIGERGATFSGGERQRLSIARALLKDAPILILDEPTSALDAGTEALLLEALERLMKGRTTFIVAHRLSTIRNASRIVVLQGGHVAEAGSHEELLRRGGAYAQVEGRLYSLVEQSLSSIPIMQAYTREDENELAFRTCAQNNFRALVATTTVQMKFQNSHRSGDCSRHGGHPLDRGSRSSCGESHGRRHSDLPLLSWLALLAAQSTHVYSLDDPGRGGQRAAWRFWKPSTMSPTGWGHCFGGRKLEHERVAVEYFEATQALASLLDRAGV